MKRPTVFISYSHDSASHKKRVKALADRLTKDGLEVFLDQYIPPGGPPEGWPTWMENNVEQADKVLVVCTPTYHRRYQKKEVPKKGRGGTYESAIIKQIIHDAQDKTDKFSAVIFQAKDERSIPAVLRERDYYCIASKEGYNRLYHFLTFGQSAACPEQISETTKPRPLRKRDGIVPISKLRSQRELPGEEFAIELLSKPVTLTRDASGRVTVLIKREGVTDAIISTKGKREAEDFFVNKANRDDLLQKDEDIQRFLAGNGKAVRHVELEKLGIRLRWASGGVLSIVSFQRRKWVPLFFRDIPPYGWNIALGSTERWLQNGTVKELNQLQSEWNEPSRFILREFIEETLVLDGIPSTKTTRQLRNFEVKGIKGVNLSMLQGISFDEQHAELRRSRSQDGLLLERTETHPIEAELLPGFCKVQVQAQGNTSSTEMPEVLVCFSLLDLGIEVVQVLKYKINDTDYLLDGEMKNDETRSLQLVKMPIALVSCDYLAKVFGQRKATLEYNNGSPPSIRMPLFCPKQSRKEIYLFSWDVKQRIKAVRGNSGTPWQRKRFKLWFKRFGCHFVNKKSCPSCAQPSNLFVPGTAKILNLYFSKVWKKK
jgi:hypothetical protein